MYILATGKCCHCVYWKIRNKELMADQWLAGAVANVGGSATTAAKQAKGEGRKARPLNYS
jgi:hypothetical protein